MTQLELEVQEGKVVLPPAGVVVRSARHGAFFHVRRGNWIKVVDHSDGSVSSAEDADVPVELELCGVSDEGRLRSGNREITPGAGPDLDKYCPSVRRPHLVVYDRVSMYPVRVQSGAEAVSSAPCNYGNLRPQVGYRLRGRSGPKRACAAESITTT